MILCQMDVVSTDEIHGMYVIPPEPPIPLSTPADGPAYKTEADTQETRVPLSDSFQKSQADEPLMDKNALRKAVTE
jgi:hypothetical protein